jgi:hypothetical protein
MIPGTRLFGRGSKTVQLVDQFIQNIGPDLGPPVTAMFWLKNDGIAYDHNSFALFQWLLRGSPGAYEVLATVVSGTLDSTPSTSWQTLSGGQLWTKTVGGAVDSANVQIQIRSAASHAVLATALITLSAGTS